MTWEEECLEEVLALLGSGIGEECRFDSIQLIGTGDEATIRIEYRSERGEGTAEYVLERFAGCPKDIALQILHDVSWIC